MKCEYARLDYFSDQFMREPSIKEGLVGLGCNTLQLKLGRRTGQKKSGYSIHWQVLRLRVGHAILDQSTTCTCKIWAGSGPGRETKGPLLLGCGSHW